MDRTLINKIPENTGKKVSLSGWVHNVRDQGKIIFMVIRDVSGVVQCVILKDSKAFEIAKGLSKESVVEIKGLVKEEKQASGGFEVLVDEITVLSHADPDLPIPVLVEKGGDEPEVTKRLDYRWLDLRRSEKQLIFKTWTALEHGFRNYFYKENYIQVYSPSIMSTASESGSEVFKLSYFETVAYLAQSPQFYKQLAMAAGFEKVFMVGPVFRAEPSFTTRHMTEFTGWDFEISFIKSHKELMDEEENMLVEGFKTVKDTLKIDIEIPKKPFPRLTMAEAKEKLKKANVKSDKDFDINPEEEKEIAAMIKKETGHDFVFITDWPIEGRPFYHMRHEDNPKLTKSFDLIYKGVEITTGAQREHRPEVLEKQAKEKGMELNSLHAYFEFFKYGAPPHGGGGIGPGRIIMQLLNLPSVKEATFLPRDVKRLKP